MQALIANRDLFVRRIEHAYVVSVQTLVIAERLIDWCEPWCIGDWGRHLIARLRTIHTNARILSNTLLGVRDLIGYVPSDYEHALDDYI